MSQHQRLNRLSPPCIVDTGIVVRQDDIKRLLNDLDRVRYIHTIDRETQNEGEGLIQEIFNDPYRSTLIANGSLYINIQSFDYLKLSKSTENLACFDLVQENRQLRLIPVSPIFTDRGERQNIDAATIEAMVTEVLSARLDMQLDDDDF